MSRATLVLNSKAEREKAHNWINIAPAGTRVEYKAPRRTVDQNARLWAMLGDVARQCPWHGLNLKPADWKDIFVNALKRELRMVPNLDGTGFVHLGRSSSDLTKEEFSDLLEILFQFGAEHSVVWTDPQEVAMRELDARSAPLAIEDHSQENAA